MLQREFAFPSSDGKTDLHAVDWVPDSPVRAVLQISHGVSEYILRYQALASFLTERGIAVAGHDHLGHGTSVSPGAPRLYFGPRGSWDFVEADLFARHQLVRQNFPDVPVFLAPNLPDPSSRRCGGRHHHGHRTASLRRSDRRSVPHGPGGPANGDRHPAQHTGRPAVLCRL